MKLKIIDRCCNEYSTLEIKDSDIALIGNSESAIEIAPAKEGHSIVIHPDMTIEYLPI